MDPGTLALAAKAGQSIFAGLGAMQRAQAVRQNEEWRRAEAQAIEQRERANMQIAETRANQTDATSRESLESELSSMRAALSANNAGGSVATLGILNDVRNLRDRERRIRTNNELARRDDFAMRAQNAGLRASAAGSRARAAGGQGTFGLLSGVIGAAPSLFKMLG